MPQSTQRSLMRQLKALGYHGSKHGMCYGISCMAILAIIADDLATFDERNHLLASYKHSRTLVADIKATKAKIITAKKEKKAIPLTDSDKQLIDILAYFENIELHQQPYRYTSLFGEHPPKKQSLIKSAEITQNTLYSLQKMTAIYEKTSLKKLLDQLEVGLNLIDHHIPIMICANNHAITIYHDNKKNRWVFINPNTLPSQQMTDTNELADNIMKAFNLRGKTHSRLSMHFNLISNQPITDKSIQKKLKQIRKTQLDKISSSIANEILPHVEAKYENLLNLAASNADSAVVKKILAKKPSQEMVNKAMWLAIEHSHSSIFKILLNQTSLNSKQQSNHMHTACTKGQDDIVNLLIKHKRQLVNKPSDSTLYPTPLLAAVAQNRISTVKILLTHHADIEKANHLETTPLLLAAKLGHLTLTKLLIEHGANTAAIDANGHTVLAVAALSGNKRLVQYLVETNPNQTLNPTEKCDYCLIEELLTSHQLEQKYWKIAEYLLSQGATLTPQQTKHLQNAYALNLNATTAKKNNYPHLAKLLTKTTSINTHTIFNTPQNTRTNPTTKLKQRNAAH